MLLSTQFLDAWGEALAESVLGNIGTLVAFRCGPTDSRSLAASLKPFTPDQLESLDRYEAVVKLQIAGATMPAFDLLTLPVETEPNEAVLEWIRACTRERYARPRQDVEKELQARLGHQPRTGEHHDVDEE